MSTARTRIEDLFWLEGNGSDAADAVSRTDFASLDALEKFCERYNLSALFIRLKHKKHACNAQCPEVMPALPPMPSFDDGDDAEPVASSIEDLLAKAEKSPKKRTKNAAARVRDLLAKVEELVEADAEEAAERAEREAERKRQRAEVKRLEEQLRQAKSRLSGKPVAPSVPAGPVAKDVRAWAYENGIECPARGRIPTVVLSAYEARNERGAA